MDSPSITGGNPEPQRSDSQPVDNRKRGIPMTSAHPLWRTSLCSFYRRPGASCSHGEDCRYAHGESELRLRPDSTWDPTSDRAKKMRKEEATLAAAAEDLPAPELDEGSLDKCLVGLPRGWTSDRLKAFLEEKGVLYKTAKKKKGMTVGFVSFDNVEQVKVLIKALNDDAEREKPIKVADAVSRSQNKPATGVSLGQEMERDSLNTEDPALSTASCSVENGEIAVGLVTKTKCARDVVTPLAHMPYTDQLEHKKNAVRQILKRLTRNARKACPASVPLPEWIPKSREIDGLPCALEGVMESPLVNGYRNKCEFSVGYSISGKRTVGFMLGNFREGVTAVEEPVDCPNVSEISKKYASIFQEFLQSSTLPVWNRFDNTGFWRQLTVREGRNPCHVSESSYNQIAELMILVQVCSSNVKEELMQIEFEKMVQKLVQGASACSPPLPLTTVVVQDHKGISNVAPADCPLISLQLSRVEGHSSTAKPLSEERIHDYISNLRFCISPTAFFQVNTLAAERLYSLAGDWADLDSDTLLFDVCCGTGTIGLTLSHRVGMVLGIEMNDSAVSDARRNAEINGVDNCMFVCGKAEDVMADLLKKHVDVIQQHGTTVDILECTATEIADNASCPDCSESEDVASPVLDHGKMPVLDDEKTLHQKPCDSEDIAYTVHVNLPTLSGCMGHKDNNDGSGSCGIESANSNTLGSKKSDSLEPCTVDSWVNVEELSANIDTSEKCTSEKKPTNDSPVRRFKKIVAIVDPPRVGLHPTVIKVLRTHPSIRKLVYISCNPDSLVANAIELCTPTVEKQEKSKGNKFWRSMSTAGLARYRTKSMPMSEPFRPVKAMAVDLFPHTIHCEVVMLLER